MIRPWAPLRLRGRLVGVEVQLVALNPWPHAAPTLWNALGPSAVRYSYQPGGLPLRILGLPPKPPPVPSTANCTPPHGRTRPIVPLAPLLSVPCTLPAAIPGFPSPLLPSC